MKLRPGTAVTPNVRLEEPIAQGAMGSVWLAEHMTLNTKVAVKFISDRLDPDDPEVLERFIREASTAAQIKSSHVVQTFDQGVMRDGTPYIVMEYLEGEELRERLDRDGQLPLDTVQKVVAQTAKALGMAHKAGIIHRDIKPENVFLSTHDDELHVKVFDFGIAKRRNHAMGVDGAEARRRARITDPRLGLTNDGVMVGTPEYMSPEQVMSASQVDHRADLWGLAVVTYVCLTGQLPFQGEDVGDLCVNMLERAYTLPSELRPEVGGEVDAWFDRAFSQTIDGRFQNARELASSFSAALAPQLGMLTPEGALDSGVVGRTSVTSALGSGAHGTLAGAATDAMPVRRWSSSTVTATVVAVLLTVAVAAFLVTGGGEPDPMETDTDAPAVAVEPVPAPAAESSENAAPEPSASATSSALPRRTTPVYSARSRPYPRPRQPVPSRPKKKLERPAGF